MDDGSRLPWVIVLVLLFCAAWFAVAETAFASVSRTKIKTAADRGDPRAKNALAVLDHFEKAITTILIGTNIVHMATAAIVTVAVTKKWGLSAVTVSTLITTVVVFFAGEMLPKSIAKKYSVKFSESCAGTLLTLMKLFTPVSALLTAIGNGVAKHAGSEAEISVTEDELYDIIEDMTEEGTLDEEQGDLISSALQFGDVTVESILTPRVDLVAVDVDDDLHTVLETIKSCGHSRLPVYEKSIDNIIGVLQIRKFIKSYLKQHESTNVRELTDEVMYVHQSTNIDELLTAMTRRRLNMAVVTDNYGGTLGIVTVEDILEELVGEIWDEDDVIEEDVVDLGHGTYIVDSEESVSDLFDDLGFDDPEDDEELVNTLMGEWAYTKFAEIPNAGDSFLYHNLKVTVAEIEHNRILKLKVEVLPEEAKEGDAG